MEIKSVDNTIGDLLTSGYYRIPRFQRPYSWDAENITDFWDDVVRDNPDDYFIGSMVVFEERSQHFGVVDGQQRLTTITLLLCAMREAMAERGFADFAEGLHGLVERKNIENRLEYIVNTETSSPFFQEYILKRGKPDVEARVYEEEANLRRAHEQLRGFVVDVISATEKDPSVKAAEREQRVLERMGAIRDALLRLKVILVKVTDEDDAYMIFETLNTRGKDLGLADLVKNHVMRHLKPRGASVDAPRLNWESILETIEGAPGDLDTDSFLQHYWLSKYDHLAAKKVFRQIKKTMNTREKTEAFLDDLVHNAKLYRGIHETQFGGWTKQERRIQEALDALQLFRVQQQTPCALALVRCYRDGTMKKKQLEDALVALERFHFLFTAATSQRSSGGISGMYSSLARKLSNAGSPQKAQEVIAELKVKLRERIPSASEVEALFPGIVYTDRVSKQRQLVRYMLATMARAEDSLSQCSFDNMTIEHIIPQSSIGQGDLTDAIVGQLGNLILVTEKLNSKLANKPAREKIRLLKAHAPDLPLLKDVLAASDWTAQDVIRRTHALAEFAYGKVWRV